jgi:hypothetical protein
MPGPTPAPEAFIPLNGSAGNSAPVTGGRRHKLKLVTRKQARKMLKKLGKKMRGGAPTDPVVVAENKEDGAMGGRRRHRGTKKTHRKSRRSLFGLKY